MAKKTKEVIDYATAIQRLKSAGFTTSERGRGVLVGKYGCGAVLDKSPTGEPQFAEKPGFMAGDHLAYLLDRGYQKVWQAGNRIFPAVADQLKALHQFEEDLRQVLGSTSLYNQSLGTVSSRYMYDRVEGREGNRVHQSFD